MAIVQTYHDAVIQVLVNDTLTDYTAASCLNNFSSPFSQHWAKLSCSTETAWKRVFVFK